MSISKIYMIKDKTNNKVFISHTVRQLDDIMSLHESAYDMYIQGKMAYKPSFDILKNKNYSIELLEEVAIKNNNDLLKRIKYYGTKYDNVIKVEETPMNLIVPQLKLQNLEDLQIVKMLSYLMKYIKKTC